MIIHGKLPEDVKRKAANGMQGAVIRMRGDQELTQAIADGMTGVELRRAQDELARLALELTEARTALEGYEELRREAEQLREENQRLRVQVEMLQYRESRYVREQVERLDELAKKKSTPPLWVRLWTGISMAWGMITGRGDWK